MVRGMAGYLKFRRLRPTALVTWRVPPSPALPFLFALGLVAAGLAVLNGFLERPLHHVYAQAVMALYFMVMVPLSRQIRLGLYEGGVWADAGFLPWEGIRRRSFREQPEIVLVVLPRRGPPGRLPVPPGEYGMVRKLLEEKIRAHVLSPDQGILGL